MKKLSLLLLFIAMMAVLSPADASLKSVDNTIKTDGGQSTSTSSTNNNDDESKSGYTSEVHIVDRKTEFMRRQFNARHFRTWQAIFNHAKALDTIQALIDEGKIGKYNVLMSPSETLSKDGIHVGVGQVVLLNTLKDAYNHKYTAEKLFQMLIEKKILAPNGMLVQSEPYTGAELEAVDFRYWGDRLNSLNLDIKNPALKVALIEDLLACIKDQSTVYVVTQKETTRYQSRKDGILENVVDQFVGSAVGSVAFQDRVDTSRTEGKYAPSLNASSYFPSLRVGFAPYRYFQGLPNDLALFGDPSRISVSAQYADTDYTFIAANISRQQLLDDSIGGASPRFEFEGAYRQLEDENNDTLRWGRIGLGFGSGMGSDYQNQPLYTEVLFGIGIYQDVYENTKVGYGIGFGAEFLFNPVSLYGNLYSQGGYSFRKERTTWAINELELGLKVYLDRVNGSVAYFVAQNDAGTTIYDAVVWGLGTHF